MCVITTSLIVKRAATPERGAASITKPLKVTPLGNFETLNAKRAKPAMQKPTTKKLKNMKLKINAINLARAALVAAAALAAPSAFATTVTLTDQSSGDLFLGFRQSGQSNDLEVDIGSIAKYTPTALGGTWNGITFNIGFGVIPGTSTPVTNLSADLSAVFGGSWATNTGDQTGVRWAVVGNQSLSTSPLTTNPGKNTVFLTQAETTLGQQSTAPASNAVNFSAASGGVKNIEGSLGYSGRQSTVNSSVALSESSAASNTNGWNTQIGGITSGSGFGSGLAIEQALSGSLAGPVGSELDLYLISNTGTGGISNAGQYLGSFSLDSSGDLTYSNVNAVPEPGSTVLVGFGLAALVPFLRRRNKIDA